MAPSRPLRQLLQHAVDWFDDAVDATLASRDHPGLTPARARLLGQLDEGEPSPSELARRLGISRQAAHKSVGELAALGLLRVERDPDNRSAQRLRITAEGALALATVQTALGELEAELARRLGRVRVRALRATLEADWGDPAG